ncbi:P-loop containing nucleoside triphosphate hydrolase protein [Absidia repens]|uniref:p-loop containing nucleoside triphosphate hydrolase protein n=1 Tax=Absidia repens TaxID=90262 RepID=A0A1X2IY28_9FUNG|nr:P-loop containing nucleoside triphosphate hydrolase protein [Absidia repens]
MASSSSNYAILPQTKESLDYILDHYKRFMQDRQARNLRHKPLVVGVSGCQGSGKTTLCTTLVHLLRTDAHNYNVVSFSLDDLYLTRDEQAALGSRNSDNRLLQYRGQPGSHDLALAETTFDALLAAGPDSTVSIPVYDKSLYGGLGDRLERKDWQHIHGQVDIILFEGWSLGFKSVSSDQLQQMHQQFDILRQHHSLHHLEVINEFLVKYEQLLYPKMDIFLHLAPTELEQVYQWRLQQEHYMRQTRNVEGLADDAVRAFVDTYMPAYTLYLPRLNQVGFFGVEQGQKCRDYEGWIRSDGGYSDNELARHLRMMLDQNRRVVESRLISPANTGSGSSSSSSSSSSSRNSLGNYRWIRRSTLILTACTLGYVGWATYHRRHSLLQAFNKIVRQYTE